MEGGDRQQPADGAGAAALRQELAALLPELRAYARFLAADRTQADDLVQEAVLRALGALGQFRPGTSLKAWLFTILRNAFFEQGRRSRREQAAMRAHAGLKTGEAHAGHAEVADLQRTLALLPPLLREALVLVGAQEMTHEEAALICGVPVGTMRARVSRARARLRRLMEQPAEGGAEPAPGQDELSQDPQADGA